MEATERKSYLIIGASSDVGIAFIRELSSKYRKNAKDAPLVLAHYNSDCSGLLRLSQECNNLEIVPIQADLSCEENAIALINQIEEYVKYPNYILHLPALKFDYMRYKELNTDYLRTGLNVQLFSFLTITRKFLPLMHKEYGNRVLVMLTSYVAEELPPKFMTDYVVAKYALLGAMKAAAAEYGNKNLKINGISPIMMETKFLEKLDPKILELNKMQSSIGRIPSPEEIIPYMMEMLENGYDKNGFNLLIDETMLGAEE